MLILLSPAKSLDFTPVQASASHTQPVFVDQAAPLISLLRRKSLAGVAELMSLSDSLAALNLARYAEWAPEHALPVAKPAVLAFDGDVYDGLAARNLPEPTLSGYLQTHLGILSGLYGLLRPLDLIRPYRLEMGTRLKNRRGADLYAYWGERIARAIADRLKLIDAPPVVVNLASVEYARAARLGSLKARVVTPVFEERRGAGYKIISFNAKRARGAMTRFAAEHEIRDPEALKAFDWDGYRFSPEASDAARWHFRRDLA